MMPSRPLRVFYLEDNSLLVFYVEHLLEELGYIFAGSLPSFAELKQSFGSIKMDAALIDIDLADGRTGPAAAAWLKEREIPSIFVSGQDRSAEANAALALGRVRKPIDPVDLSEQLRLFESACR